MEAHLFNRTRGRYTLCPVQESDHACFFEKAFGVHKDYKIYQWNLSNLGTLASIVNIVQLILWLVVVRYQGRGLLSNLMQLILCQNIFYATISFHLVPFWAFFIIQTLYLFSACFFLAFSFKLLISFFSKFSLLKIIRQNNLSQVT